jgi:hypothetical protein
MLPIGLALDVALFFIEPTIVYVAAATTTSAGENIGEAGDQVMRIPMTEIPANDVVEGSPMRRMIILELRRAAQSIERARLISQSSELEHEITCLGKSAKTTLNLVIGAPDAWP